MSANRLIKSGDMVTSNGQYPSLKSRYFYGGPLKCIRVEENGLDYTGYAFVYLEYSGREIGMYINGIKKS